MSKIKVLITGSNGILGQKVVNLFVANNYHVVATSRGENRNNQSEGYEYISNEIDNLNSTAKLINKVKPNFIIHTAAMTNVDSCELRQHECKQINAKAVKNIVKVCKELDTHLIHISTDFVFKGKKGFYTEDDKTNPLNFYGKTKNKSEKYITKSAIDYTILRTIILYGINKNSTRSNIVLWVKNSLEANKPISVVTDQYRMPTYVNDLAEACLLSVQKKAKGIYHISSNELLSIYEIALEVAKTFNLNTDLIKPILTDKLNQKAERPKKTGFIIDKAVKELGFKSVSFKEQLQKFKNELETEQRSI
ncbi:MAG TPA: SDR family oxidoreductase [Flavobacteriaceae bacterium]|nr:SDR family oxidoreductase [Flavobacteriaceae bacterium]